MMNTSIGTSSRRPAARTLSTIPMRRKISMVRALHRSIFGRNCGASFCSINVQRTPRLPRSMASVRPTGPPPTTITCVSIAPYSASPAERGAALDAMEFAILGGPDPKTAVGSQFESSFPHRSQPARGAHKASEAEKMDSGDRRTARTRNVPHNELRAGLHQKARNRLRSRLEGADRVPDPAQHRESEQPGQARRPRKPDAHRQPVSFHLRRPREDRLGLETELRHEPQIETRPPSVDLLLGERNRERGFRYLGMAFGVTRHANVRDAMPLEQARLEQREARLERPARPVAVAGDHQGAVDTRLARCARQVFVERVAAGDLARRDVRNRSKPGAFQ